MSKPFSFIKIPRSRIATFDVFAVGLFKHHVSALLEFDVTESRKKLRELRKTGTSVSFNGWLIKSISKTLEIHREATAFLYSKRKLIVFDDINISILVEKLVGEKRVPIPLVIEKTNEKSAQKITKEIEEAQNQTLSASDIVLKKQNNVYEKLYYRLPGFLRRLAWKSILRHPKFAFSKMGNVVVTSPGMVGQINGWFIHKSIHPLSFGIGSVLKKPVVVGNEVKIREILNVTILFDHDVIDGAPMMRFVNDLKKYIEGGGGLNED